MPSRFERDLTLREPAIVPWSQAKKVVAKQKIWVIENAQKAIIGFCTEEVHAKTIASHLKHFQVRIGVGEFEFIEAEVNSASPQGRFLRILEDES